mmetsp:Transcript_3991/g.5738  ORF Transcript_3991/g.5738 Transcript_3991/m.5738 type:complete len:448 (+) Transcript_3991:131-1474(+)|eukprot:CAMPEP_0184481074 /NCGR_PEP_ID=MMETSP0113_2-20130426/2614_1 /TAXON_ID=91329 /ORGANISM="Norrisiella sphaerica, Strain BC52" /LENGTH=447 /DNA_ID=CAMNT_0026859975 /DNA_START=66 /DNA_END=1409 /DNA_ORIENTATION=+
MKSAKRTGKKWIAVFEDVLARFVHTLPSTEKESERLFVQLEQAHWFYEDFVREKDQGLKKMSLKEFCMKAFEHVDFLRPELQNFQTHWNQFKTYLKKVPTCGAIILNPKMSKVVMVQGWNSNVWAFPKGKVNRNEGPVQCAVREVLEETGVDISQQIREKDFMEAEDIRSGKIIRLYIICGIQEHNSEFKCNTRKEISAIEWVPLSKIGEFFNRKGDSKAKKNTRNFYPVLPFFSALKHWIKNKRRKDKLKAEDVPAGNRQNRPRAQSDSLDDRSQGHDEYKLAKLSPTVNPKEIRSSKKPQKGNRNKAGRKGTKSARNSPNRPRKIKDPALAALDDSIFGIDANGWSPEEMFRYNEERFGLKSSVPVDDITEEERKALKVPPRRQRRPRKYTPKKVNMRRQPNPPPRARSGLPAPVTYYNNRESSCTNSTDHFAFNTSAILSTLTF